ncbi:expressed protein, partial [Phakopsora pachyrhizi]
MMMMMNYGKPSAEAYGNLSTVNLPQSHQASQANRFFRASISLLLSRASRRTRVALVVVGLYILWWSCSPTSENGWIPFSRLRSSSGLSDDYSPKVSRGVLERLSKFEESLLNLDFGLGSHQTKDFERPQSDPIIPLVTSLPESRLRQPGGLNYESIDQELEDSLTDINSCPAQSTVGLPCGFLLAGFVGEQETKAQVHAHQLGLIALSLNRTLVLPQVAKGRMGSCSAYPFDLYYDSDALDRLGVPTITHAQFQIWLSNRSPSARMVSISDRRGSSSDTDSTPSDGTIKYLTSQSEHLLPIRPYRNFCVAKKKKLSLNFESFPTLLVISPERWHLFKDQRDRFARRIMNMLRKDVVMPRTENFPTASFPDVLVFNYELRYPLLEVERLESIGAPPIVPFISGSLRPGSSLPKFQRFAYAPIWNEVAISLIDQLPPLVTIQWRQETVPVERLEQCMKSLLVTLSSVRDTYPSLKVAYLSTDYPIESITKSKDPRVDPIVAHSGTFSKLLSPKHHQIMRELMSSSPGLSWMTFDRTIEKINFDDDLSERLTKLPNMIGFDQALRIIPGRLRS